MKIILEGVDASGKSTLARRLVEVLSGYTYYPSEGPEKYAGEIIERLKRYDEQHNPRAIYDRHPIISHPIYSRTNLWMSDIPNSLSRPFYERPDHLFVYCLPTEAGFDAHQENEGGEDPQHLAMVKKEYSRILTDYNEWAFARAHMLYRCGWDFEATVKRIARIVS